MSIKPAAAQITTVCVTLDQDEALTLSDRIIVMRGGEIEQTDAPEALYDKPTTRFVAKFSGEANILEDGDTIECGIPHKSGSAAMIRPERIRIAAPGAPTCYDADQHQSIAGTVDDRIYAGPLRKYRVRVGNNVLMVREHVVSGRPIFRPGDEAA
ncbi:TOBE domain-containing protein [Bradyrhizobium sp. CW9]|uniref:TOBE domain-containing protein n=1 Tax=Bradyrhizobium sp. CW9 TaxID=2782689 RepID=UPI003211CE8C